MIKNKKSISYLILSVFCFQASFTSFSSAQTVQPPESVENVKITANQGNINLTWDIPSDPDGKVIGYKVYYGQKSVPDEADGYAKESWSEKNSFNLRNQKDGTYYFSITAFDNDENQSLEYSEEVSIKIGNTKTAQPQSLAVKDAENISDKEIKVTMSAPVKFNDANSAFFITNITTQEFLQIEKFKIQGKHVILTVPKIRVGQKYEVLATSMVKDLTGNPVASGVTDNVKFTVIKKETYTVNQPVVEEKKAAPIPPKKVTNLRATQAGTGNTQTINLSWTKSLNATDYIVYKKSNNGAFDKGYSIGNTNKFSSTELAGKTYTFKVVAVNSFGQKSPASKTQLALKSIQAKPKFEAQKPVEAAPTENLAESGPGSVIALMITIAGSLLVLRRRYQV